MAVLGTLDRPADRHTLRTIRNIRKAILLPVGRPTGDTDRLFPASAVISPMLFPYVDRDGLTKPLIQLIAEDAIESGIQSIAVLASPAVAEQCRLVFRDWEDATVLSGMRADWVRLQQEKLTDVGGKLQFVTDAAALRTFVEDDDFAIVPADVLYVSGTKDRCLEQLITVAANVDGGACIAVEPVMLRQVSDATIVRANSIALTPTVYRVAAVADQPSIDECRSMHSPGLPPDHFFAATGLALFSSRVLDPMPQLVHLPFASVLMRLLQSRAVYAGVIAAATYDLRTPYGRLESQLGLGLAGVHRFEICEMIARTLAQQAKS